VHHKATLTIGKADNRPYHIQCACGSAGDFNLEAQAVAWINKHFSRIGPSETSELFVPGAKGAVAAPQKPTPVTPTKPAPPPAPGGKK